MTTNNEIQLKRWEGSPWYPAIKRADEMLSEVIPGYVIEQIKDKFGGLRYYYSLPENLNTDEYRARADKIISYAEGWVDGYEDAKEESK